MPGLSETWDINVGLTKDGQFAWQTSGDDPDECCDEAINTGTAEFIAEYLVGNAWGVEAELIEGLLALARTHPKFLPLLNAVKAQLENAD